MKVIFPALKSHPGNIWRTITVDEKLTMNDQIADMLIRIKNAGVAGKETLVVAHSRLKAAILEVLVREGFIASFTKKGKKVAKFLEITLREEAGKPRISGVERVSRPSRRVYESVRDIKSVRQGYGSSIISTPQGIMTDKAARRARVGGEVLFKIW